MAALSCIRGCEADSHHGNAPVALLSGSACFSVSAVYIKLVPSSSCVTVTQHRLVTHDDLRSVNKHTGSRSSL